jgi:Peptidase family M28
MNESVLRRRLGRGAAAAAVVIVLAVVTVLSLWAASPPAPRGTEAPASTFSAARAHRFLEGYATRPHPVGSAANDAVRDYIVSTLTGFGLSPEVQDAVGVEQHDSSIGGGGNAVSMARVRNVVVKIPGTQSTGRVFLVAHYDSVQNGPGANDDGAGVGSLLETARALTASNFAPRNDVVLVFTDAEEACLCGAEAFASQDPLAADGGVVLNLEARGSSGPPIMFETSRGNAKLVKVYGTVPHPVGTSFAVEVYRILPNDTDFSAFRDQGGFTGLNSAYIDGSAVYHSPEDTLDRVDEGSLQAHGDNALALAKQFGTIDLTGYDLPAGHDDTYFPVFGKLVVYPGWLVWPLAALALLVVLAAGLLAVRQRRIRTGQAVTGFGLALIPLLLAAVGAQLYWLLLTRLRPGYADMMDPWQPGWFRIGVCALTVMIVLTWYALARRRFTPTALSFGALTWLAVLGVVLAAATPGGSYLGAIPALAGGLALLVTLAVNRPPQRIRAVPAAADPADSWNADTADNSIVPASGATTSSATTSSATTSSATTSATTSSAATSSTTTGSATPGSAATSSATTSGGTPSGARASSAYTSSALSNGHRVNGSLTSSVPLAMPATVPAPETVGGPADERPTVVGALAELLGALVGVVILAPTAMLFFPALGLATGGAAAFFVAMLGLAALPALEWLYPATGAPLRRLSRMRRGVLPAALCLVLAVAATGAGFLVDGFDARHPHPSQLMYALDKATGQARWVSSETTPGAWTSQYLADSGREDLSREFPLIGDSVATGRATVADLPAPTVRVVAQSVTGGRRALTFDLVSHRTVRLTYFEVLEGGPVSGATVDGRALPEDQVGNPFGVLFHAPPDGTLRVTLVVDGTGPVKLRVMDGSDGLAELPGFTPRPADVTIAGTHTSDMVLVADTVTIPAGTTG